MAQAQRGNGSSSRQEKAGESQQEQVDVGTVPRDALLVDAILRSMGVRQYEPRVVAQLLEFIHRHVSNLLNDAVMFQEHAGRNSVDVNDVRLAIRGALVHSFVNPPPRQIIQWLATTRNRVPLPVIPEKMGIRLPPDEFCLTSTNYNVEPDPAATPGQTKSKKK